MTRARARARTGGQPPLTPSWVVTPENLPPGYVYTGGLRTQVNADGSIGWAPHNLVRWSESLLQSVWTKNNGAVALSDTVLSLPAAGAIAINAVTTDAPVGQVFTVSVELSGSGTVSLGGARLGAGTYEDSIIQVTLTTTPTRYTVTKTVVNSGQTGWQLFVTRRAATSDTATEVTMSKAIVCYGPVVQPYLLTTSAPRYEPRTADYSDSMAPVLGPELVADPSFENPASWTTSAGGSVSGGVAAASSMGQFGIISRTAPTVAGKIYRVEFDVVSITAGAVRAIFHGASQVSGANVSSAGRFSAVVGATSSNTSIALQSALATPLTGQFDNFSVREITGYAGVRPNLEIEAPATNLLRNSQCAGAVVGSPGSAPTNWLYAGRGAPVSTVGIGFEGAVAYVDIRIQGTLTDLNPFIDFEATAAANGAPAVAQASYVGHVHVRRLAGDARPLLAALRFGTEAGAYVNDAGGSASIASDAGSVYVVTGTPGVTATRGILRLSINAGSGSVIDMTLRISRPQMEIGTVPTSYIPTYGSQVTRAGENIRWPTASIPGYNASRGTFALEISTSTAPGAYRQILSADNGIDTSDRFPSIAINADGNARLDLVQNNAILTGPILRPLGAGKIAASWASGSTAAFATSASFFRSTGLAGPITAQSVNTLILGNRSGQTAPISMAVYRLAYYPRAATDAQLQALTA